MSPGQSVVGRPSAVAAEYIPALDGLRAVAILLVVASHAGLDHVVPGAFGVTLFFFVSGYLITRQLLGGLARQGRVDLPGFYARRVLRLAPAGLAYTCLAGLAFVSAGGAIGASGWLSAVFYGANIYDLWSGYRSSLAGVRHPFNILWSLAIEEHFYALWPLVLAAVWRARWAWWAVLGLCLGVLAWRVYLFGHCTAAHWPGVCGRVQAPPWQYNRLYLGTDTRLDSIAWGALLALGEQRGQRWVAVARHSHWVPICALVVLATGFVLPGPFARHVIRTTLQGAALLCLMPALLGRDNPAQRLLCAPPAILVGRLSYSLYLWHWGAFALADGMARGNRLLWLAIGLPLAAIGAALSYWGVERPMLRLRRRFGSHAPLSIHPVPVQEGAHAAD